MSKVNMPEVKAEGRSTGYCQSMWQKTRRHLTWAFEPVPWYPGSAKARATTKDTDKCVGELLRMGVGVGSGVEVGVGLGVRVGI